MQTKYRDKVSTIVGWGHWFTFANILIAIAVGIRYAIAGGWPTTALDNLYLVTYLLGHFAFVFFAGFVAILFPLAFVVPWWRVYRTLAIIVATIAQSMLLLDCEFYSDLGIHSNPLLYELLFNAQSDQLQMVWWKSIAVVGMLLILQIALANWLSRWRESRSRRALGKRLTQVFFSSFFIYNFAHAAADVVGHTGITRQQDFFPLSFPLTAKTTLNKWGISTAPASADADAALNVRFKYPLVKQSATPDKATNVVVVVISSLQADMLNSTNMPYTTALARSSLWANNYFATAKSHHEAMFGLLYGIPATYSKLAGYSQSEPFMTSWLNAHDYELGLFSTRTVPSHLPHYRDFETQYVPTQRVNAAIADTATLHHWQQHYQQHTDKPSFHLINLMGVERFATPPGFSNPFQPDLEGVLLLDDDAEMDEQALTNRYKNAVLHADQLVNYVASNIDFSNTILVVTSDAGWSSNPLTIGKETANALDDTMHVPFIMSGAGIQPRVLSSLSSHYDISATLVQMLSSESINPKEISSGLSMIDGQTHSWLLLGRQSSFAVVEPDRFTLVYKFGDYKIFDNTMQRRRNELLRIAPMANAVREMQRFTGRDTD
ncbi:DUF3413 domain-containing protein [Neiella marina]|uniref:DUF3413 domain-containing protein n=1 Tax=Neiella holothuriorum TaxID=2870530 RepID=A0ABS7EJX5_9GAMM|nr:DUF3413 domain-containing protein [Neiella holothuriorum]MBW8192631.1 DUF3413 domain-containing protein [Neiella holothuriorum]